MSEPTVDLVESLLALSELPPGTFNPFDARTLSPDFRNNQAGVSDRTTPAGQPDGDANLRRFCVKPDTWDKLGEITELVNDGRREDQTRTVSPYQVGSVLLEEAVEEGLVDLRNEEARPARFIEGISTGLVARLESEGGRPTVPEWGVKRLTGYADSTWEQLQELASQVSTAERKVSPSQIASYLVEQALASQASHPPTA
jgi:hypothetical protein